MFFIITRILSIAYLIFSRSIPLRYKILPLLGMAYFILPRDLILDLAPLGLLDDLLVFSLLFSLFVSKSTTFLRGKNKRNVEDDSIHITDFELADDAKDDSEEKNKQEKE